jgi:hypothetical protein
MVVLFLIGVCFYANKMYSLKKIINMCIRGALKAERRKITDIQEKFSKSKLQVPTDVQASKLFVESMYSKEEG